MVGRKMEQTSLKNTFSFYVTGLSNAKTREQLKALLQSDDVKKTRQAVRR